MERDRNELSGAGETGGARNGPLGTQGHLETEQPRRGGTQARKGSGKKADTLRGGRNWLPYPLSPHGPPGRAERRGLWSSGAGGAWAAVGSQATLVRDSTCCNRDASSLVPGLPGPLHPQSPFPGTLPTCPRAGVPGAASRSPGAAKCLPASPSRAQSSILREEGALRFGGGGAHGTEPPSQAATSAQGWRALQQAVAVQVPPPSASTAGRVSMGLVDTYELRAPPPHPPPAVHHTLSGSLNFPKYGCQPITRLLNNPPRPPVIPEWKRSSFAGSIFLSQCRSPR